MTTTSTRSRIICATDLCMDWSTWAARTSVKCKIAFVGLCLGSHACWLSSSKSVTHLCVILNPNLPQLLLVSHTSGFHHLHWVLHSAFVQHPINPDNPHPLAAQTNPVAAIRGDHNLPRNEGPKKASQLHRCVSRASKWKCDTQWQSVSGAFFIGLDIEIISFIRQKIAIRGAITGLWSTLARKCENHR